MIVHYGSVPYLSHYITPCKERRECVRVSVREWERERKRESCDGMTGRVSQKIAIESMSQLWVCERERRERKRDRERELFKIRRKLSQSLFSQRNRLRSDQRFYFPGFSFDLIPMSGLRRVNMKYDFPDGNKPFLFKLWFIENKRRTWLKLTDLKMPYDIRKMNQSDL